MGARRKPKTWAEEIADLDDPTPRDFEPENENEQDSALEDDEAPAENEAARDHYEDVEKSALRRPEEIDLDPQYTGAHISRKSLNDDDPFGRKFVGLEEEEDSDDSGASYSSEGSSFAVEEDDHTSNQINGHTSDQESDSFSGFGSDTSPASEIASSSSEPNSDDDLMAASDASSSSSTGTSPTPTEEDDRATIRRMMADSQKSVRDSLTRAARSDIEKGRAIKRQRMAFDSLLNTRIKLQKALIASNSLSTVPQDRGEGGKQAADIAAAESAALNLFTSLSSLRSSLTSTTTSSSTSPPSGNPPPAFTPTTPTSTLSTHLLSTTQSLRPQHREVLAKWSARTAPIAPISKPKFSQHQQQQQSSSETLIAVLDQHLSGSQLQHHINRTRIPRSCAPVQAAKGVESSRDVYDDADFYALLLRELVEQRGAEVGRTGTQGAGGGGMGVEVPSQRDLKVRKQVDRKASKGRKMRYNVHEKLQNFMVPEDLGGWEDRQRAELFASLLGKKPGVNGSLETDDDNSGNESEGEEKGLRLFG